MFGESQKCANISSRCGFIFFSVNISDHRSSEIFISDEDEWDLYAVQVVRITHGQTRFRNSPSSVREAPSLLFCVTNTKKKKLVSLILGYHAHSNYNIENEWLRSFRNTPYLLLCTIFQYFYYCHCSFEILILLLFLSLLLFFL